MTAPSTTTKGGTAPRSGWRGYGLSRLFEFALASQRRTAALLVLVSLAAFLPGFFRIPPVDRDEAYFAQATKQMIETGDYVNIRYQRAVRYRKPVGIYWLQAAAVNTAAAFGMPGALTTIWLYRIPSLLAAIGAVLATYWCALAFLGRRHAALAALMLAVSVLLGTEARLAKTDAVLAFTVVLAMGALARAYRLPRAKGDERLSWPTAAIFWSALALGILDKGPMVVMVVALAAAAVSIVDRSARWLMALRPLPGFCWLLLVVLPWFIAIYLRAGNTFFVDSVGHDMLAKVGGGQEAHGAPPGYYLLLFFVMFFPASALAIPSVPAVWTMRRTPTVRFLLAWLVPSWLVFELVATKLPNYVLPLYPAIAILIAGAMENNALSQRPSLKRATVWWCIVPAVFAVAAVAIAIAVKRDLALLAWPFLAGAIVCGLFAWRSYDDEGAEPALLRAFAAAILAGIGVYGVILPSLRPAFPSVALANVLHAAPCAHAVAASAGYGEPSLVFLAGTDTRLTDAAGAANFLRAGGCRYAFVEAGQQRSFALRAQKIGLRYKAGPRIQGFNVSNGRWITMGVFQPAGVR